jgi:hypothetical protein
MQSIRTITVLAGIALLASAPFAQSGGTPVPVENALAGIKLYDTGVDVVKAFGSPTDIEAVVFGTTAAGGGAPGSGPGAGGGFTGGGTGGGAAAATPRVDFIAPPLGTRQGGTATPGVDQGPRVSGAGAAGGGQAGGAAGQASGTQFVRWIYRRSTASSMNFVLNNHNKVVQIEALGISNTAVRTSKAIRLGSTFADVVKNYGDPDGYDVGQDYFMIRYLQNSKVAFRFARENANSPYRVTGIVVSAGKA